MIVAQASYTAAEFELFRSRGCSNVDEVHPTLQIYIDSNAIWSKDSYRASLAALHRMQPRRAFFSHDPTVWTRAV